MQQTGTWATDFEIRVTANLLQTHIFGYSPQSQDKYKWHCFSPQINEVYSTCKNQAIYLKNTDGNHYDVVLTYTEQIYNSVLVQESETNTHTELIATDATFNPVGHYWQEGICSLLDIPLKQSVQCTGIQLPINQLQPSRTTQISDDGNCFFRAVSYCITGSQTYHICIRHAITNHMLIIKEDLSRFIPQHQTIEQYLQTSCMKSLGTWGTETEIYTAANLFQTSIYIYSTYDNVHWDWRCFTPQFESGATPINEQAIYLQNTNRNHYDVVTKVEKKTTRQSILGPTVKTKPNVNGQTVKVAQTKKEQSKLETITTPKHVITVETMTGHSLQTKDCKYNSKAMNTKRHLINVNITSPDFPETQQCQGIHLKETEKYNSNNKGTTSNNASKKHMIDRYFADQSKRNTEKISKIQNTTKTQSYTSRIPQTNLQQNRKRHFSQTIQTNNETQYNVKQSKKQQSVNMSKPSKSQNIHEYKKTSHQRKYNIT